MLVLVVMLSFVFTSSSSYILIAEELAYNVDSE